LGKKRFVLYVEGANVEHLENTQFPDACNVIFYNYRKNKRVVNSPGFLRIKLFISLRHEFTTVIHEFYLVWLPSAC
jgi:hypothetical protein